MRRVGFMGLRKAGESDKQVYLRRIVRVVSVSHCKYGRGLRRSLWAL